MALKFRKSIKIAPGVRVNLGSKSAGISFGTKGLRYSINSRTGGRATVGIPGTGISYTSRSGRSYKSGAYSKRADIISRQQQREKLRRQKELDKELELENAKLEVEEFENKLELVKSIHKECDEYMDWVQLQEIMPPFKLGEAGPKELAAREKLDRFKPNFFHKLFRLVDKKRGELEQRVSNGQIEDKEDYAAWQNLTDTAQSILNGDLDAYLKVIEEMSPLDDLSEFGSGFEFFVEHPDYIEVEFDVKSESAVPKEIKTLTKTGKLSVKAMPKSQYFDILQDYVCSCILRIARDMFALLPIRHILIHAMDNQLNTETGYEENITVISVKIDRPTLESLNFESIDCSDAMKNFKHNMKFFKTSGFKPVDKLIV